MAEKLTDLEWASKAEAEGLFYAITEYGLKLNDLEDQESELAHAVAEVEVRLPDFWAWFSDLEEIVEAIIEDGE